MTGFAILSFSLRRVSRLQAALLFAFSARHHPCASQCGCLQGACWSPSVRCVARQWWKNLQLAPIFIQNLRGVRPTISLQHVYGASTSNEPPRACEQRRRCCRHKVSHWLPLAGDREVLNPTTVLLAPPQSWACGVGPGSASFGPHFIAALERQQRQD